MSWFLLDDRFHAHPKVQLLLSRGARGREALGVHEWCASWCRAFSPEKGQLSAKVVALGMRAREETIARSLRLLVDVELMDAMPEDGIYHLHDWDEWQLARYQRAGKARAAGAVRQEGGRFGQRTSVAGALENAGETLVPAGPLHSTPLHSTPLHSRARGGDVSKDITKRPFRELVTEPR